MTLVKLLKYFRREIVRHKCKLCANGGKYCRRESAKGLKQNKMAFNREHITEHGKAAFYACILGDLKDAAASCGWAIGLHGSLATDMDLMAMPWTEDAKPVEEMIRALSDCFTDNLLKEYHTIPHYDKPNGRVVYTMSIWSDFYLDINVIQQNKTT